jgi:hypothetical protein
MANTSSQRLSFTFDSKRQMILRHLGPPILAFLLARCLLLLAAASSDIALSGTELWKHFDSEHYLSIARQGYAFYPCTDEGKFEPDAWCGTSGWFPGYPLLIKAFSFILPSPDHTALMLSGLLHLATLMLLWSGFFQAFWQRNNVLCLLLAAFFPGQVYQQAIFPISLVTFLILLFIFFIKKEKFIGAGLTAAMACFTYPTGFLLPVTGFFWLLFFLKIRPAFILAGLGCFGLLAVALIFQFQVGRWDAYIKTQEKYGHRPTNPFSTFYLAVEPLFQVDNWRATEKISLVSFKTEDGHFLSADGQDLLANRTRVGDWETFERIDLGGKLVALRAHTGLFLCTSETGGHFIKARCPAIEPQAIFREINQGSFLKALKTGQGNFLCPDELSLNKPVRAACSEKEKKSFFEIKTRKGTRGQQRISIAGQTALLFGLVLTFLFFTLRRQPKRNPIDLFVMILALVCWLTYLSFGSGLSLYRAEALLLPSIFLGRHLPAKLLSVFLILAVFLAFQMGRLFFMNILI